MTAGEYIVKTLQGINRVVEWIIVTLTGSLVLVVFANVFARYVLHSGLLWAEEVSRLAFVWVVFLGAYLALVRQSHLAITLVTNRLPHKVRVGVRIGGTLLVLMFLAVVMWYGAELVRSTLQFGRITPILGISAAWGYLSVPVAALLMFLETLRALITGDVLADDDPSEASV